MKGEEFYTTNTICTIIHLYSYYSIYCLSTLKASTKK